MLTFDQIACLVAGAAFGATIMGLAIIFICALIQSDRIELDQETWARMTVDDMDDENEGERDKKRGNN
jgi:hypothetical protein